MNYMIYIMSDIHGLYDRYLEYLRNQEKGKAE